MILHETVDALDLENTRILHSSSWPRELLDMKQGGVPTANFYSDLMCGFDPLSDGHTLFVLILCRYFSTNLDSCTDSGAKDTRLLWI